VQTTDVPMNGQRCECNVMNAITTKLNC